MINLSVPDTIDERAINKKKLTPFIIQVCTLLLSFHETIIWGPVLQTEGSAFCIFSFNSYNSSELKIIFQSS